MDYNTKEEISGIVQKLIPEIEKRFTSNQEKRNLREFLIAYRLTKEKFLKKLIDRLDGVEITEGLPSVTNLESLTYSFISGLEPKKNAIVTDGMYAAGMKFFKVFAKLIFATTEIDNEQLKNIDSKLKLVMSSIAQNEGSSPDEIMEIFEKEQLSPSALVQYQKSDEEIKEDLKIQALKYNVRYELNEPGYVLNISYTEVKALATAYNENRDEIRISGELLRLKKISKLKIFTIEDQSEFENEIYWSRALMPEAKKLHNRGTLTYERFCEIGNDVTSKFLNPITDWQILEIPERILDISALIKKGEGRKVEFKSRFRWNSFASKVEPQIELTCLKAIAGFLNTDGGVLFIGVSDDGNIIGIQDDFDSFSKENKQDELKKHFDNLISSHFGKHINALVVFDYYDVEGKSIAYIKVKSARSEVFMKRNGVEEFYVRRTASTVQLQGSELLKYIRERWKK